MGEARTVIAEGLWAGCRRDWPELPPQPNNQCFADADDVLAALSAVGYVLLPPGGEASEEWGTRLISKVDPANVADEGPHGDDGSREEALAYGQRHVHGWIFAALLKRQVRFWEDDSEYIGPWAVIESFVDGEEVRRVG